MGILRVWDETSQSYKGIPAIKGDPGDTPVKGVDYFTAADIQECAEAAAELVEVPTVPTNVSEFVNDSGYLTKSTLLNLVYPVGSIYISVNSTSPQTFIGGTWERLQDRFLLGAGSTYSAGATGGEATHTLTVDEMPSHSHTGKGWANITDGSGSYYVLGANGKSTTYSTNTTGGGAAHNNMPPYLVVYMWKRTA